MELDRFDGKTIIGQSTWIDVYGRTGDYHGELDEDGMAYGKGVFTANPTCGVTGYGTVTNYNGVTYSGTFKNNQANGFCTATYTQGVVDIGEKVDD